MDRETTDLNFGKHTFKVKTYATAREAHAIQQAIFKGSKIGLAGAEPKIDEFNTEAQFELEQESIRQLVVSMDDSTESILERCLDLPSEHFDALTERLADIIKKKES